MTLEERKTKLHTLAGYLLSKYDLSHHSVNHRCFIIKPLDAIYIVNNYTDILESSNLYISKYTPLGAWSCSTTDFKVEADDYSFRINQKSDYESKNNYETYIKFRNVSEIKLDISCKTILSFDFRNSHMEFSDMFSFRND